MFSGKRRYWWFQFIGWSGLFLIHLFFAWFYGKFDTPQDRSLFFTRAFSFVVIGVLLTHLMRLFILRLHLLEHNWGLQLLNFLLLSIITASLCGIIEQQVYKQFALFTQREIDVLKRRGIWLVSFNNMISWFIYMFIWNAIYIIYHYARDYQQQQIDTLRLKSLVRELELKTIKSNINPHFIFNALNSIRALVDENPGRAREAITELSNILRSSITMHKTESVALKNELAIIEDYLALEQVRFEDRLAVSYQIDSQALEKQIPPMMLQMLVENAIKHGISRELQGGSVSIAARLKNNLIELCVCNTGKLTGEKDGTGFGLNSIRDRLKLLYPGKSGFEIRQLNAETVEARIELPA
ncbi:histidine kinase [Niabella pedocola]|uniref:Histidine kinase n=1 Tax=Niabella pedocola TaxID=1752077 RepID=A0ABS8PTS8_9BACT|nr:histidine kinase [Niabella pedocola]MCD2423321.1 histidine kinase [Niabella pedocola]